MRKLALLFVLCCTAFAEEDPMVRRGVEELVRTHKGKVAVFAKHLNTGKTVSLDADRPVKTASVIKVPIMMEAFNQVNQGRLNLADRALLKPDDRVEGSGILQFLGPGLELTTEDAIVLMITLSDNTATNLVIDKVGIPQVNTLMLSMGLKSTHLYKKVFKPAEGPLPAEQKLFGLGKTTARESARLLESLENCDSGDPKLCRRMLEIMRNQQHRSMIPRYLETVDTSETASAIANKTGSLDAVRNDIGIVYSKTGPIVLSIFTYDNEDQSWTSENQAEILIGRIAKVIVDGWGRGTRTALPEPGGPPATSPLNVRGSQAAPSKPASTPAAKPKTAAPASKPR